jgi:hypothetical protein
MLVLSFLALFSATTLAQLLNENGACRSLHDPCQSDEYDNRPAQFNDVFNKASCTAYFTCGVTVLNSTVDNLIDSVSKTKFPPKAASGSWPPFSVNVRPPCGHDKYCIANLSLVQIFNQHSTDGGKTWSQQNYIDFYYGELANRTQVFPNK